MVKTNTPLLIFNQYLHVEYLKQFWLVIVDPTPGTTTSWLNFYTWCLLFQQYRIWARKAGELNDLEATYSYAFPVSASDNKLCNIC